MTAWTALTLALPPDLEDEILAALQEAGTLGVQVLEPVVDRASAVAYFDSRSDLASLRARLVMLAAGLILGEAEVAAEPWVERQQASRRPIHVGARFLIVPQFDLSSAAPPAGHGSQQQAAGAREATEAGRITLVIPSSRAFGTGEHETTQLCLECLETLPVAGRTVLDLGTGTGILAMAAARLGAVRVAAVDNDPEAAEIAAQVVRLNAVAGAASPAVATADLSALSCRFDLILANLFPGALESASRHLAAATAPKGVLVISGFPPEEADSLSSCFAAAGFVERRRAARGEWCALILSR